MVRTSSSLSKHKFFWFLSLWFILTQTFPPINILLPVPGVLRFPIFVGLTMLLFPDLLLKKSMICLYIYIGIAFLFFLAGNDYYGQIGRITNPLLDMSAGLLIAEYVLKYDTDYKYTRKVILIVIVTNVVMSIISIPQVYLFPNIIRISSKDYALERYSSIDLNWLISYQTCHGLPLLFAPMVFLCKKYFKFNKKAFSFWLISTMILFYIVYLSNATTALLISVFVILLAVFSRKERFDQKSIISLVFLSLMFLILASPNVLVPILDFVQSNMDSSWSNYHKIDEIRQNVLYGSTEGDLEARSDLYKTSLNLFIESPILGTSQPELISHHTWLLDNLACFGMFLIIPVLLILFYNIKSVYKSLLHTKLVYAFSIVAWLIMLTLKGEFGQGSWLYGYAFLPLLCRFIDNTIDVKLNKIKEQ